MICYRTHVVCFPVGFVFDFHFQWPNSNSATHNTTLFSISIIVEYLCTISSFVLLSSYTHGLGKRLVRGTTNGRNETEGSIIHTTTCYQVSTSFDLHRTVQGRARHLQSHYWMSDNDTKHNMRLLRKRCCCAIRSWFVLSLGKKASCAFVGGRVLFLWCHVTVW